MSDLDIKNIRKKLNFSQNELSKLIGVSLRTVQNWEAGETIPKTKHEILRNLLKSNESVEDLTDLKTKSIPLVSATAVGGLGNSIFAIGQKDVKDHYVIPKFQNKKVDFMIEVEGSSMYPKYNSGDVVACRIINDQTFIQWNKTHVISTKDQGIIIKRINPGTDGLMMVSDNKEYPPFEVPKSEIDGIAIVVGVIRLE